MNVALYSLNSRVDEFIQSSLIPKSFVPPLLLEPRRTILASFLYTLPQLRQIQHF